PLRIDGKRYSEIFNTSLQNGYILMKQAEETLFNRRFSFINKEGNIVKSRWIQQIEYLDNQGAINICFTKAVVEAITRIDGFEDFFTQYYLEQTAQLKSVYSVRLYELLVQWKVAGKTKLFEVQTFRSQMGVEDSEYKILADFKKRV
ncbi:RepB family plasmid replication initiator protein, partial [Streptomyces sp. DSM 41014]